jgi:hypothetical protein
MSQKSAAWWAAWNVYHDHQNQCFRTKNYPCDECWRLAAAFEAAEDAPPNRFEVELFGVKREADEDGLGRAVLDVLKEVHGRPGELEQRRIAHHNLAVNVRLLPVDRPGAG